MTKGVTTMTMASVLALLGCVPASTGTPQAQAPASAQKAEEPTEESVAKPVAEATPVGRSRSVSPSAESLNTELMSNHFVEVDQIREAVIAGRLGDTSKPAHKLLYASEVDTLPVSWQTPVIRMQGAAKRLQGSHDMVMAAAATADIGTSCGSCHRKLGGPSVSALTPPGSDGSLEGLMAQHVWATERLWEGLYVPSLDAWNAGLAILTEAPFPEEVFAKKGMYARTAAADFARTIARAPRNSGPKQQAKTYAALLATCATCHLASK